MRLRDIIRLLGVHRQAVCTLLNMLSIGVNRYACRHTYMYVYMVFIHASRLILQSYPEYLITYQIVKPDDSNSGAEETR